MTRLVSWLPLSLLFCCLHLGQTAWAACSCATCTCGSGAKTVVGAIESIAIKDSGLSFASRIDTGARLTSVHATDIEITDPAEEMKENVGKTITFTLSNEKGAQKRLSTTIDKVSTVRNSQGVEQRYEVTLTLQFRGKDKKVAVNLRDRSKMTYKLLIGRNWLSKDYLVDVDQGQDPTNPD